MYNFFEFSYVFVTYYICIHFAFFGCELDYLHSRYFLLSEENIEWALHWNIKNDGMKT